MRRPLEVGRWGGAAALEGRKKVERCGGLVRWDGTASTGRKVGGAGRRGDSAG